MSQIPLPVSGRISQRSDATSLRYHLILYYMTAFEQRRKAMKGLALCASSFPQPPSFTDRENVCVRSHVCSDPRTPTAVTSTTPTGLLALLLASGGNFMLPILLSAAQLAVSRRWPDSDIPQDIERVKVVVNIAGAATTSLVAALKRWRFALAVAA